jgi:S-methylmethionine-dependent homocysteine/selenocysteine methylase
MPAMARDARGARHRARLPQLDGRPMVTDGGLETELIFHRGIDLPHFAAVTLLDDAEGAAVLRRYYEDYALIAREHGAGLVMESPTWRANPDWGARLGYSRADLERLNLAAIMLLEDVRAAHEAHLPAVVVSGCIGPRGDGYVTGATMSAEEAEAYHGDQVATFARSSADVVSAFTLTYEDEAVGIVRAARSAGMPVVIAFTVETDGRLPNGSAVADAVARVDAEAGGGPDYYMINCAHPDHFAHLVDEGGEWLGRLGGLRANASRRSHAELDESTELDEGDPDELGALHRGLAARLPALRVVGGCCGTDHRHVRAMCEAWLGVE